MKIQKKSEKGMGERGWGRKREGEDWQKADRAPHLACALGPTTWGSGPDCRTTADNMANDVGLPQASSFSYFLSPRQAYARRKESCDCEPYSLKQLARQPRLWAPVVWSWVINKAVFRLKAHN